MQKIAKWGLAVFIAASLFISCSELTGSGGGKDKLITADELAGKEVQPGQAAGVPTWEQLEGKYDMDVFVLMGADFKPDGSPGGYIAAWDENTGAAEYHQTATFIKNPDGKTFKILLSETRFGVMPVAPVVIFPKVVLAVREDKTVTFKSLEKGFTGFVALDPNTSESPIKPEDWNDIEKMKEKVNLWSQTSSIRPETSEVRLENGNLVCKIDTNWNLNKDTIHTKEEQWKQFAPMFENVKSASATKGKYKGVYDETKHGTLESGGILEVVPVNAAGRSVVLPLVNAVRSLPPCEPVTIEVPADAQAVTPEEFAALPFLGLQACLHSRGVSHSTVKTLKNKASGLPNALYQNTVNWNFTAVNDTLVFTSESFVIGRMPISGVMKITVPLASIKRSGTVYYFNGFNADVNASSYTVLWLGMTRSAPLTHFKAAFDTANNSWLLYSHIVGTVQMFVPMNVNMEIHSRGTAL